MHDYLHAFLHIWMDMAPWLLIGFGLAFICSWLLSERAIRRHLGGPGWLPIFKASGVGLLLPICSCGVLLVGLALRKNGARKAPVCSFLASTPQAGTDALLVSLPMLGWPLTLLRFLGAILSGIVTGALVRWFGIAQPPPHEEADLSADGCSAICACHHHSPDQPHAEGEHHHHEYADARTRCREAATYAFIHLPSEIAHLLIVGVALAAALDVILPHNALAGYPILATYLLAILIGVPTYACSLAILPIAAELIAGGLSVGAVFVFMACAPTTHIGALLIIGRELGWRTAVCFLLGVILVALSLGVLIDLSPLATTTHALTRAPHAHHSGDLLLLIPLALILLRGLYHHGRGVYLSYQARSSAQE